MGDAPSCRNFGRTRCSVGYSRLVLDLNRALNDPACFPETSDRTPVPGNQGLTSEEKARRAAALFHPYHDSIRREVRRFVDSGIAPVILSIHSFTPIMREFVRPWHVGVLWHEDGRIAKPLLQALSAVEGLVVGDNEPYSAREPASFTVEHHATELGLAHVAIEVRQDLIDTEDGARHWADVLRDAFTPILADELLYRLGG